jgi:hypothetical protein
MWIFSKEKRFARKFSELAVVYTYSIEDIPGRTLAVKVPRESVVAAKHALLHAHKTPSHKRINRDELLKAVQHLDKVSRRNTSAHFAGPTAAHVSGGLVVGAKILGEKTGKKVLTIQTEVLTNHQYVDVVRIAA